MGFDTFYSWQFYDFSANLSCLKYVTDVVVIGTCTINTDKQQHLIFIACLARSFLELGVDNFVIYQV